jgi:hypothetical protein
MRHRRTQVIGTFCQSPVSRLGARKIHFGLSDRVAVMKGVFADADVFVLQTNLLFGIVPNNYTDRSNNAWLVQIDSTFFELNNFFCLFIFELRKKHL